MRWLGVIFAVFVCQSHIISAAAVIHSNTANLNTEAFTAFLEYSSPRLRNADYGEFYMKHGLSAVLVGIAASNVNDDTSCATSKRMLRWCVRAMVLFLYVKLWQLVRGKNWYEQSKRLDVFGRWLISASNFALYFDHVIMWMMIWAGMRALALETKCLPGSRLDDMSKPALVMDALAGPFIHALTALPLLKQTFEANHVEEALGLA
eukprot:c7025_g1_i1.p1 GENE.c7025_g1_i1~~c7025_g1_i1.p1  ORF type:complete len:213 (+),score=43.87 c7025_g1_i1:24-641(+)